MNSSFFIVVDRGNLKAYRAEKIFGDRPPRMHLVQGLSLADAHFTASQKYTDGAGSFPAQTGSGSRGTVSANSVGEKHYDIEDTRRSVKQLGAQINDILRREKPDWWSIAAPSDIQEAVLAEVDPKLVNKVAERVARDLVNVPANHVLDHFSAVRAEAVE